MAIIKLAWGFQKNMVLDASTCEILTPEDLKKSGEGRVLDVRDTQISVRDDGSSLIPTGTYDPRGHYQFAPKVPGQNCKIFVPIGIDHREQKCDEAYPIIIASTSAPRLVLIPVNGRILLEALLDDFESFESNLEFDMDFIDPRSLTRDTRHVEVMGHKARFKLNYTRFVDAGIERVKHQAGVIGRLGLAQIKGKWVSVNSSGIIEKIHDKNPIVTSLDGELGYGTLKKTVDGDICVFTPNEKITVFSQDGTQKCVIDGINKLVMHDITRLRTVLNERKATGV